MSADAATEKIGDAERRWLKDGHKNLGFVADIDAAHLDDIVSHMTLGRYDAGKRICVEGESGDAFYIIYEGGVEVTKNGWTAPVGRLIPGEFFGEMALLDGMPRSAGAKGGDSVAILTITRANYAALRDKAPKTALKLMDILVNVLSNRLRQTNKNLEAMAFLIE